ncbi:hypothetical protein [Azospirillum doebereinerae]|uniref:Uncharacterized protein n=1 Tax=Azospirillum doebereinerae TaxID=92933 RepID=A0A433J4X3_9PROT|nr:hypothetical protein [Azospirillum doebereinerae]RUQ67479.1 hypothetical protein EJ913_19855 [Azospirillum doebereinerae]
MMTTNPRAAPILAARIATFVSAGRPYLVWAIPGDQPPAEAMAAPCLSATFMVDGGCALVALNDPHLTAYIRLKVPLVFACERKVDRRKLLKRRAAFSALGYRLWEEDARGHPVE